MAEKISFNDLIKKQPLKIKEIKINDKKVEVKQYLPVNEKLNLITNVLQAIAGNEYNFVNPVQLDVYTALEIVYHYTNIDIAEDAKSNPGELYDTFENNDIINAIVASIPETEYNFIVDGVQDTVTAYYAYKNSALGIMENITQDYSNLDLDATKIQEKMADPNSIPLLKAIVDKLG